LIDHASQCATVVAVLRANVAGVQSDAVPQPREDLVLQKSEAVLRKHRLQDIRAHRVGPLHEVTDARLRRVSRWVVMLLNHLMP
jgi:hypothetical protein